MRFITPQQLRDIVIGRDVQIHLPRGMERRLHAYMLRIESDLVDDGMMPLDPTSDKDISTTIVTLLDLALSTSEEEAGVRYSMWGERLPLWPPIQPGHVIGNVLRALGRP